MVRRGTKGMSTFIPFIWNHQEHRAIYTPCRLTTTNAVPAATHSNCFRVSTTRSKRSARNVAKTNCNGCLAPVLRSSSKAVVFIKRITAVKATRKLRRRTPNPKLIPDQTRRKHPVQRRQIPRAARAKKAQATSSHAPHAFSSAIGRKTQRIAGC